VTFTLLPPLTIIVAHQDCRTFQTRSLAGEVFYWSDATLNTDFGATPLGADQASHVASGVDATHSSLVIGFEDMSFRGTAAAGLRPAGRPAFS
jgi:hypothetical protein